MTAWDLWRDKCCEIDDAIRMHEDILKRLNKMRLMLDMLNPEEESLFNNVEQPCAKPVVMAI